MNPSPQEELLLLQLHQLNVVVLPVIVAPGGSFQLYLVVQPFFKIPGAFGSPVNLSVVEGIISYNCT